MVKLLPPEKTLRHNRYVTDMDWSSSQSKLATTSKDNDLKIWRVDVGKVESRAKGIAQINLVRFLGVNF